MDWVHCKDCVCFEEGDCEEVEGRDGCYFGISKDEYKIKHTVAFEVEHFKQYIYAVIRISYEMGVAYVTKTPSFSKEEAIKRFQDMHWEDLKRIGIIKE